MFPLQWERVASPQNSAAVAVGRARVTGGTLGEVGVVCFEENRGLCSLFIHNKDSGTYSVMKLNNTNLRNHGSAFSLIAPLERHSADSPVLFAVHQDDVTANEVLKRLHSTVF